MTLLAVGGGAALRDIQGQIIKPGLVRKRLEWNPTTSATVPSFVSVAEGTATVSTWPGVPGVVLAGIPGTTTNAALDVGPAVERNYKLVASSIRAIGVDTMGDVGENSISLHLRNMDAADGAWTGFILESDGTKHSANPYDEDSGATRIRANHQGMQYSRRSVHRYPMQKSYNAADVGLFVSWENYTAYGMEGNDVVCMFNAEGLVPKYASALTVQPRISVRAPGSNRLRIARIVVDHWYF